jgi:hypothetical protein
MLVLAPVVVGLRGIVDITGTNFQNILPHLVSKYLQNHNRCMHMISPFYQKFTIMKDDVSTPTANKETQSTTHYGQFFK